MSSDVGNKQSAQGAAEAPQEGEIRITDKRRVTPDSVSEHEELQNDSSAQAEIETLQAKLKEAEEKC